MDVEQLALAELLGDDRLGDGEIVVAALDPVHQPATDVTEGVERHRGADYGTRLPVEPGQAVIGIGETHPREFELASGQEADGE